MCFACFACFAFRPDLSPHRYAANHSYSSILFSNCTSSSTLALQVNSARSQDRASDIRKDGYRKKKRKSPIAGDTGPVLMQPVAVVHSLDWGYGQPSILCAEDYTTNLYCSDSPFSSHCHRIAPLSLSVQTNSISCTLSYYKREPGL